MWLQLRLAGVVAAALLLPRVVAAAPPASSDATVTTPVAAPAPAPATTAAGVGESNASRLPLVARASGATTFYTDTDHVTVVTPVATAELGDRYSTWNIRAEYLVDVISAASVDVVSTASQHWNEVRQAGSLEATYKPHDVGIHASGAVSREPDYSSTAGGLDVFWDFAKQGHTVFLGYARDQDTIGRTGTPFSVFSRSLAQDSITAGVSLTLGPAAVLSMTGEAILERGDQSKPYRYIPMFSAENAAKIVKGDSIDDVNERRLQVRPLEQLPLTRERYSLTARFGYRFAHATLRIDERLYTDTWLLHASTTEIRYIADLSRRWTVWPWFRFNAQTPVFFWNRAYVARFGADGKFDLPAYRTGDRELGPLSTFGLGAGANFAVGPTNKPSSVALQLHGGVIHTEFLDDLYVTSRNAELATLTVLGVFE
ncbi:MAG TPA: DUF3570 domain-containing protein [Polyangiaceae bacterium]|jgi:hypothetical protein|nr:DUF3570 domain-containing protein [Polyangiaceae bacterium]